MKDKKPRLGQHFLTRSETAGWVADAIPLTKTDTVLEVGPGEGILTRELLGRAGRVIAFEKDARLIPVLKDRFSEEVAVGRCILIHADIRDVVLEAVLKEHAVSSYSVVANIPYYISGMLIRFFLEAVVQPTNLAFLVQKEVAERACAKDGKESLLSLAVALYGTPGMGRVVKPGAFSPPPQVDSAILTIQDIHKAPFDTKEEREVFFAMLHTAFGQKRKRITTTLKEGIDVDTLEHCGILPTARPETLSLPHWLCLHNRRTGLNNK
jgi:16S rRNA (adenine1518-N6/adenine1519-N6)-dimethyltransferase